MDRYSFDKMLNGLDQIIMSLEWMRNHDRSGSLNIAYGKLLETRRECQNVFNLYERIGWK